MLNINNLHILLGLKWKRAGGRQKHKGIVMAHVMLINLNTSWYLGLKLLHSSHYALFYFSTKFYYRSVPQIRPPSHINPPGLPIMLYFIPQQNSIIRCKPEIYSWSYTGTYNVVDFPPLSLIALEL